MSHFTNIKTEFKNLIYLEKALNKLNIEYQEKTINASKLELSKISLVIPQSNGYDIVFDWNGQHYELIIDMSYWEQPYPIENFIDKIAQKYAGEVIVGESQKYGFQPITYNQNTDRSTTLILERWNNGKIVPTI
jgi:hypothetical protein